MNILVTVEQRFERTPDGKVWTPDQYPYSFLQRYLEVFDGVKVLSRVKEVETVPETHLRADGAGVSIVPIPFYYGMTDYLRKQRAVARAALEAVTYNDAMSFRVPSVLADIIITRLKRRNFPYAVEITSDPHDVFAPGGVQHPLRPLLRQWFMYFLKQHTRDAVGASYVTNEFLQRRYPTNGLSVSVSSVVIDDAALAPAPNQPPEPGQPVKIIFVGSFDQIYKAPDILVEAVRICTDNGLKLQVCMAGDGKHRAEIEALAAEAGLTDRITFLGKLPGAVAVRQELDTADLFVLPSRAEGLPRAVIEAQARGLPCISTTVGGIPELLPPEDLVPPNDAQALAAKITEFVTSPERMAAAAKRNLEFAGNYHIDTLRERLNSLLHLLADRTAAWQARHNASDRAQATNNPANRG